MYSSSCDIYLIYHTEPYSDSLYIDGIDAR